MKLMSGSRAARLISLSALLLAMSAAQAAVSSYPVAALVVSGFHCATLAVALLLLGYIVPAERNGMESSVLFLFLAVNVFYIFAAGSVYSLFRTELYAGLALYYVINLPILATDTLLLMGTIPASIFIVPAAGLAAGIFLIAKEMPRLSGSALRYRRVPQAWLLLLCVSLLVRGIAGMAGEASAPGGIFRGLRFGDATRARQTLAPGFRSRFGYNISGNPDIVIIILEGVSAGYFDSSRSAFLGDRRYAAAAEKFFVPVPHTTLSIYSLLTGNYGNYRSRQRVSASDVANSLPSLFSGRGYKTFFLYSGPTYFEGLDDMLGGFGMTIINKEALESRYGGRYKSFEWGVDDASLCDAVRDISSGTGGPAFFFIGLSSTHSPYFNPHPERFNRFDNSTAEGRYRNCIDYDIHIIDRLIALFTANNSNTLFIIMGDHGESFGQGGYVKHSFSLYNTEICVPFMIYHQPSAGRFSLGYGSVVDVYPTIADMFGLVIPAGVEGRSMFGVDYRLSLFLSSWRDGGQKGLIHGDRKWIYTKSTGTLFEMNLDDSGIIDLTGDPGKGPFVRFLNSKY